ncbi:Kelch repeat-containing protein [Apiospora hydei]|uniref:Kelch repeat-containing protein n=1 Tax=Apiospora hydei TaxID=1337664 RepID=A0ABR1V7D8_9PEZI
MIYGRYILPSRMKASRFVLANLIPRGCSLVKALSDTPYPSSFIRHPFVTVAVVGDYVYFDGGELAQSVDGVVDEKRPSYQLNTTLSLSLSSSWTNASATIRSIPKSAPCQNIPITWFDASASSFYEWGGYTAWGGPAVDNLIWKFTADGSGGGAWSKVIPTNIVAFNNAARLRLGRSHQQRVRDRVAISGLASFDTGSLKWENVSSTGYGKYGTSLRGRMESVPFGPNGLLMVLGGAEAPVGVINTVEMVSWDTVSFVDPGTGKWYSQATTDPRPTRKQMFCSVGVQGPNGTYEIFIYGSMTRASLDEIHVLSLPGFVIFKSPSSGTPRNDHACCRRLPRGLGFPKSELDSDPWKQGLGVFDLTDMVWKSQYNADARPYDTPKMIQDWYAQGGNDLVSWASEEVKALFRSDANKAANPGGGTSDIPGSGSGSSPDNPSATAPTSTHSQAGAIAGGAVGGVAGIVLIAALTVLVLRRRRRARQVGTVQQQQQQQPGEWPKSELPTGTVLQQSHGGSVGQWPRQKMQPWELYSSHGHSELGPGSQHEMAG